jgi:hypothetical protein
MKPRPNFAIKFFAVLGSLRVFFLVNVETEPQAGRKTAAGHAM